MVYLGTQQRQTPPHYNMPNIGASPQAIHAEGSQQYWGPGFYGPHAMSPESSYYTESHDVWNSHYPTQLQHFLPHSQGSVANQQPPNTQAMVPSQNNLIMGDWSGDEANNSSVGNQASPGVANPSPSLINNPSPAMTNNPSPTMTICGSEVSSPGTPMTPQSTINGNNNPPSNSNIAPSNNVMVPGLSVNVNNNVVNHGTESPEPIRSPVHNRQNQARSPYEWMKRTSYQNQPNPGKTRTKDKYRVVYTDHQRLELEKEFHYSRYITIRRKAELAQNLNLSERQVKIWFQNRRAKERKLAKKATEGQGPKQANERVNVSLNGLNDQFRMNLMQNINFMHHQNAMQAHQPHSPYMPHGNPAFHPQHNQYHHLQPLHQHQHQLPIQNSVLG